MNVPNPSLKRTRPLALALAALAACAHPTTAPTADTTARAATADSVAYVPTGPGGAPAPALSGSARVSPGRSNTTQW